MVLGKVWLCLFTADFWKGSYLGRSGWGVSAKFRGLQAVQLFREDRGNQAKGRETRLRVGPVDDDIGPFGCAANSRKVACVSWVGLAPPNLAQTTILCILQLLNSILASSVGASVTSVSVRKQTCVDRITEHHFTSMGSQDPTRSLSLGCKRK